MANQLYDYARYLMLNAGINWPTTSLELVTWTGVPTFVSTDKLISDIKARGGTEIAYSASIAAGTVTADGTAQTKNVLLANVPVVQTITWMTLGRKGTPHDTGQLILYIDDAVGLPFAPNGLDMIITPDWMMNRGWFRP